MSIRAMSRVWKASHAKGGELLVMLAIADFADDCGVAYPSIRTLAQKARLTERQVQRVIKQLVVSGELEIQSGHGPYGCHLYRVTKCRGDNMSEVTSSTLRGDIHDTEGVTPTSPKPSEETVNQPSVTNGFDRFWTSYPKKRSKGQAERAWMHLKPSEQLQETILQALTQAKCSTEWTKENGQFIPYPATWLRAKGWEDEYIPANGGLPPSTRPTKVVL